MRNSKAVRRVLTGCITLPFPPTWSSLLTAWTAPLPPAEISPAWGRCFIGGIVLSMCPFGRAANLRGCSS